MKAYGTPQRVDRQRPPSLHSPTRRLQCALQPSEEIGAGSHCAVVIVHADRCCLCALCWQPVHVGISPHRAAPHSHRIAAAASAEEFAHLSRLGCSVQFERE